MPFLAGGLVARPLRIAGVYQAIGVVHFVLICIAAWNCGVWQIFKGTGQKRVLALAGTLLLMPFALIALLWVGLGTPGEASPTENRLRYVVLLASSMSVATAFVILKEAICDAGERFFSTVGFAANLFSGAAYLVWLTFYLGLFVAKVHDGQVAPALISVANVLDTLLFAACVLTYLTTMAFAASLAKVRWLGSASSRAYVFVSTAALTLIIIRGLSFPNPAASSSPWYTQPGFIAGIPAVPWIMPCLLGAVLLRRAGAEGLTNSA